MGASRTTSKRPGKGVKFNLDVEDKKMSSKSRDVAMENIKSIKTKGIALVSVWAALIFLLVVLHKPDAVAELDRLFPNLRTIYAAGFIAFAFATALDVLAFTNAVSEEKRVLSIILTYVDGIACASYFVMAFCPYLFGIDTHNGYPVQFVRYVEWTVTCPTILYWIGLIARADSKKVMDMASADALISVGGVLASLLPGWLSHMFFMAASAIFVHVMYTMWTSISNALEDGYKPEPPLPKRALKLLRAEILLSWSMFPILEFLRQQGYLSYETGEGLICATDYAAKVGLAMIIVNCNLEMVAAVKVGQMEQALAGVMQLLRKSAISSEQMNKVQGMDDDVKSWLLSEYTGAGTSVNSRITSGLSTPGSILWDRIDASSIKSSDLFNWGFDTLSMSDEELLAVCVRIFEELRVVDTFDIDKTTLRNFIGEARSRYRKNPFHNFKHAVLVLHTTYMMISTVMIEFCTDVEIFALLVAALTHDCDHDGVNNAFHVNSRSKLALRYNDQSVLENHHCSQAFDIVMQTPGCNIFAGLTREQFTHARGVIVECILGTDMAKHNMALQKLQDISRMGGFVNLRDNDEQRIFVMKVLLHTSDLYNPTKPFEIAKRWALQLQREFNNQVKEEESQGLPSLPFMKGAGERALAKGEIGFMTFVIMPWWEQLEKLFPKLDSVYKQVESNLQAWKDLSASFEEE